VPSGDIKAGCSDFDGIPLGAGYGLGGEARHIDVDGTGMHGMRAGEFAVVVERIVGNDDTCFFV